VVGCGLIAQVMHLHHLREHPERFEVGALCDVSPGALRFAGERWFPQARRFTDWQDLLDERLDAVMVLTAGSHAPVAIAGAEAGLHVFVEKPVSLSVHEGLEMVAAAERAGVWLMAGYMKRFEPAYEALQQSVAAMTELRLVRVTTLESPLEPYVQHYPLARPDDADPDVLAALADDDRRRVRAAIGAAAEDPTLERAYRFVALDCIVHEFNALRGVLGEPTELSFAQVEDGASGVTLVLRFGRVACVQTWTELPGIARYEQEFALYAPDRRASLCFPSPFLRNTPARLVVEDGESGRIASRRTERVVSYQEAFERELLEFHAAVTEDREPLTPASDGVADVALAESLIRCLASASAVPAPTTLPATSLSSDGGRR
jgi:predicted dehydrogenase